MSVSHTPPTHVNVDKVLIELLTEVNMSVRCTLIKEVAAYAGVKVHLV